jgi:hypothetical protein
MLESSDSSPVDFLERMDGTGAGDVVLQRNATLLLKERFFQAFGGDFGEKDSKNSPIAADLPGRDAPPDQ